MRSRYIIATSIAMALQLGACRPANEHQWVTQAPAGNEYTHIERDGTTVLPNGRLITPRGRQIQVAPHPYGLVLSPDGSIAVTANSGVGPFSVSIIRNVAGEAPQVQQVPEGYHTDAGILASVYMGLAISPDNTKLYVAGGQEGKIFVFDLATGKRDGEIDCDVPLDGVTYEDSYIGDLGHECGWQTAVWRGPGKFPNDRHRSGGTTHRGQRRCRPLSVRHHALSRRYTGVCRECRHVRLSAHQEFRSEEPA